MNEIPANSDHDHSDADTIRSRRMRRFIVRAALLVVGLICLLLVPRILREIRQQRAVDQIERLGGTVWVPDETHANWLYWLLFEDDCGPTAVQLDGPGVTDADLAIVAQLTSLQVLHLPHTRISDDGLAQLGPLVRLQHLNLGDTTISDAAVIPLANLTSLRTLNLPQTRVTPAGEARLRKLLPNCSIYR